MNNGGVRVVLGIQEWQIQGRGNLSYLTSFVLSVDIYTPFCFTSAKIT